MEKLEESDSEESAQAPERMVKQYFKLKRKFGDLIQRVEHPDIGQEEVSSITILSGSVSDAFLIAF
jgi:hypothetical protein